MMTFHFPKQIRSLQAFQGPFDAFELAAKDCKVLFASYPAGTKISSHTHDTHNVGVITQGELVLTVNKEVKRYGVGDWYCVPANAEHAALFEQATSEIEFWFISDES